jgi:hypothetical protein
VCVVAGGSHDGDDLLDLGRIGRIAQPLVARRMTGVEAWHRRRRSTSTGTVEQQLGHGPSSGSLTSPTIRASLDRRARTVASATKRHARTDSRECRGCLKAALLDDTRLR